MTIKNVYILQNSQLSFDMDISKLYSPNKYNLYLIVNQFGSEKINLRRQRNFFQKIWILEDFGDENIRHIIDANQKKYPFDLQIVTNAEEAIYLCGRLRQLYGVDLYNYDRFKDKVLMKKLVASKKILIPSYTKFDQEDYLSNKTQYINNLIDLLVFPLIVKPIDSMGCLDVEKISNQMELEEWCEKASTLDVQFEIDEYVEGTVYNCDSYIKEGKILFIQVSECLNSCFDFLCGSTKGTIALPHTDLVYKQLCEYTKDLHEAIGMPNGGVTHLEVIMTERKDIYFIEIGHRSPGILIPQMYKKFLNIDTIESHILLQIDNDFDLKIKKGNYCAWIAFPMKKGKLEAIFLPEIASNIQVEWIKNVGDNLDNPRCGRDYVGRALIWNTDYQQLRKDFDFLNSFHFYSIAEIHPMRKKC